MREGKREEERENKRFNTVIKQNQILLGKLFLQRKGHCSLLSLSLSLCVAKYSKELNFVKWALDTGHGKSFSIR